MITPKDYQDQAARTLIDGLDRNLTGKELMTVWCACGLAGEAGEVMEVVKKGILHQHGLDLDKLQKEIGDAQWYLTGLCTVTGLDLGAVMEANIEKLKARYPDGFDYEASKHRG